ncbi:MAG: hypothetical protein FJZ00_03135, partial [Candidatus Sericytochromatia bacterium]|nr:hypothetical protein [Candidatus Tanganyikabacteria bacterium]
MKALLRALALLTVAILGGCFLWPFGAPPIELQRVASSLRLPIATTRLPDAHGVIRFIIEWPTGPGTDLRGYQTQLIPDSTSRIDLSIKAGTTTVATASVVRNQGEATKSVTVGVPRGNNYSVIADAFAGGSGPIARGAAAGVNVRAGQSTDVSLIMLSLFTPAITGFDNNIGAVGSTIRISGLNLRPTWSAAPIVTLEGAAGASVSANVTASATDSITFTIPANAACGRVEVKADGVRSFSTSNIWVAGSLALTSSQAVGDTNAANSSIRDLLFDDVITFSASHSFALAAGRLASDYGVVPLPTWPVSGPGGTFSAASGYASDYTAPATIGDVNVAFTLGATSSATMAARVHELGA